MTQATISTILPVPSTVSNEAVMYLPQIFHKGGVYIPESTIADMTRDGVINDIASGAHEGAVKVIAVDIAAGKCWDASREIAMGVLAQVLDFHGEVPRHVDDFLTDHLGVYAVRAAERQAA